MKMDTAVYRKIEAIIGVPFVGDEIANSAVCFACSEELRADFRIHFSVMDVVNYLYGIIYESYQADEIKAKTIFELKIPFPKNDLSFWKYSFIGQNIRLENTLKELDYLEVCELNWCDTID